MSIENRSFFVAGGESLRQCEEWHRTAHERAKLADEWGKELGAKAVSFDARCGCNGMEFEAGKAPKGWVKHPRWPGWYTPSDAKKGKQSRERMASMRPSAVPGKQHFGSHDSGGVALFYPACESIGGVWVISQHKDCKEIPLGSSPIKASRYLAMKEDAVAPTVAPGEGAGTK